MTGGGGSAAPADERLVPVRGGRLFVSRTGAVRGAPLVLAHGLFGSVAKDLVGEPWLHPLRAPEAGVDLVLYDARGHGRSDAAASPAGYAFEELGRDLLALLDALGLARAVLGGTSLGAATAIAAAALAPERVLGLVLLAPPPVEPAWSSAARPALAAGARVVRERGIETLLQLLESRPENRSPRERPERWAWERSLFAAWDPARLADLMEGVGAGAPLALEGLGRLGAPALLVDHDGDPDHPVDASDRIAARLRRPERVRAEGWDEGLRRPAERAGLLASFARRAAAQAGAQARDPAREGARKS